MTARKCQRCRKRVERLGLVDRLVTAIKPAEMLRIRTDFWSSGSDNKAGFETALRETLRNAALRLDT